MNQNLVSESVYPYLSKFAKLQNIELGDSPNTVILNPSTIAQDRLKWRISPKLGLKPSLSGQAAPFLALPAK